MYGKAGNGPVDSPAGGCYIRGGIQRGSDVEDGKEEEQKRRSLGYSLRDGMAWSVMAGCGDNYVGAFAVFLSATTMQMGLLSAIPTVLGAAAQIGSAYWTERALRRKRIIVPAAIVQGLMWIPLVFVPLMVSPAWSMPLLILFLAFYSVSGQIIYPPWCSLMGDLVPENSRGEYFAKRGRLCHVFSIVAIVMAGISLHMFKSAGHVPWGFMTIFLIAAIARLISSLYLHLQYEPPYVPPVREGVGYFRFLKSAAFARDDMSGMPNFARYVWFSAAMNFSFQLSGPFFEVYILRDLGFSYLQFTVTRILAVLTQILTLVLWGGIADRFGNKWTLQATGVLLGCLCFLLPVSTSFAWISFFLIIGNFAGAGYNLAALNYVFDAAPAAYRARYIAYFSLTNACGAMLGSTTGGWLAQHLPAAFRLGPLDITFVSSIITLYLVAGVCRLVSVTALRTTFQEVRAVEPAPGARALFRMVFLPRDLTRWLFPGK